MKNNNLYYQNKSSLKRFINENNIVDSSSLLIQVFVSKSSIKYIQELVDNVKSYLPSSKLIGTTADGGIINGRVNATETIISFTSFEKTSIDIIDLAHENRGFKSGQEVAKTLIKDDTKVIISFATCYNTSGEDYLNGISSVDDKVIVSGGIATHNVSDIKSYVFTKERIISSGVVAVALQSKDLHVFIDYSYNWSKIGLELRVDEVVDNRVYKIDNKTPYEIYAYYLGEDIAKDLPKSGIEFPLIVNRDGFLISRAVTRVYEDGSLEFAGDFKVGDKVQFGYGDIKSIHKKSTEISYHVAKQPVEAIFIYSCLARRQYLNEDIENEILPLEDIAPTSGFFTYGEFYSNNKKEFLNQTMTLLVLSESEDVQKKHNIKKVDKNFTHQAISINALANLINVVSTEVNKQKKELTKQKNLFENLFENSADGILIIKDGVFVQCNERVYKMLDYSSKNQLLGKHPSDISPKYQPDKQKSFDKAQEMISLAMKNGSHQFEWVHTKFDNTPIWMEVRLSSLKIENKDYTYATLRDIQKKKKMENELLSQKESLYLQANYDFLTGLANRNLFYDRLSKNINTSKREKTKLALLFIDLDMFKDINDSLGHDIGDMLLKDVASRLQNHIRAEDTVARIGGDEFTIIIEKISDIKIISNKANDLLEELEKPYSIQGHRINISCSIGISIYPDDTKDLHDLIKYADTAMYKAKSEGKNKQRFYSNEMTKIISEKIKINSDIRDAIKNNHFEPYYQVLIDAKENKIIGAEALIRWICPQKGLIFPDVFIPVAETSDLIIKLDDFMMETAMKKFSELYDDGLSPGMLSLNLSMKQLESPNFIAKLEKCMKRNSFKASWLKLEILEREVMREAEDNIVKLNKIKDLGVTLAIDDFGTGESSFTYLSKFPVSQIKIDKFFVMNMHKEKENQEIVKAIIALGNALNLKVIAEGVESNENKEYLLEKGCSYMQGYYFSKPIKAEDFTNLLKTKLK